MIPPVSDDYGGKTREQEAIDSMAMLLGVMLVLGHDHGRARGGAAVVAASELVPEPYELVLLALAAGRAWKIVGDDRILERPRDWLLGKLTEGHRQDYWGDFPVCPWCAGFLGVDRRVRRLVGVR